MESIIHHLEYHLEIILVIYFFMLILVTCDNIMQILGHPPGLG